MKPLKEIAKSIKYISSDIKAEVVIADLIDKGTDSENIQVQFEGLFGRNHTKDIKDVQADMVRNALVFYFSQDGLYDLLPEGLFHPATRYNNLDAEERKKEFKKQKQEEINARKFFQPLDNEIFFQKVKLELELLKLFRDPIPAVKQLFLNDLAIPKELYRRFISFLPFSNEIKGDIELTAYCLSEILGEKVFSSASYKNSKCVIDKTNDLYANNNNRLGENFICGDNIQENLLTWEFSIILSDESSISKFADFDEAFGRKLVDKFYRFFIPVEIEVETKYICETHIPFILGDADIKDSNIDSLEQPNHILYLGYNTSI